MPASLRACTSAPKASSATSLRSSTSSASRQTATTTAGSWLSSPTSEPQHDPRPKLPYHRAQRWPGLGRPELGPSGPAAWADGGQRRRLAGRHRPRARPAPVAPPRLLPPSRQPSWPGPAPCAAKIPPAPTPSSDAVQRSGPLPSRSATHRPARCWDIPAGRAARRPGQPVCRGGHRKTATEPSRPRRGGPEFQPAGTLTTPRREGARTLDRREVRSS